MAGCWWLEHDFYDFVYIGNVIIPTDELIFFRGVAQPPTRKGWTCLVSATPYAKQPMIHRAGSTEYAIHARADNSQGAAIRDQCPLESVGLEMQFSRYDIRKGRVFGLPSDKFVF